MAEGPAEIILEQLVTRFGPLPDSIRNGVRGAAAAQFHAVANRVSTAPSLETAHRLARRINTLAIRSVTSVILASGRVREVLPQWQLPPVDLWAVFPNGRQANAKARAFCSFVETQMAQAWPLSSQPEPAAS